MNTDKIGSTRIADIAGSLYDGGWRKDDRELMIEEYDLTADEADAICELLGKIEEAEEAEDEMEEAKEAEAMEREPHDP